MSNDQENIEIHDYMVSIFMLTYNQEEFIVQAIESVLAQKTNFYSQLVIGEDFSTDKTREICKSYAEKYPNRIKLLLNKQNIGLIANYVKTYNACTGKYVAICDGDDYWIDELKLQKQVNFLENDKEYKIIFTHNLNLYPSGDLEVKEKSEIELTTHFEDLVIKNYMPSVTVMFKREKLTETMNEWLLKYPFGDWPTYLFIIRNGGKIYFLNDITAVYRKNFGTSKVLRMQRSRMGEINLAILKDILSEESFMDRSKLIKNSIFKYQASLMASYNKEKRFFKSFGIYLQQLFLAEKPVQFSKIYLYSLKRTFNQIIFKA